ncbi:MAG: MBL fold metallo-hydrolase, partial [Kribbellaceae bacterium]|nr:MBL fold metallo-hydrolase [Kribbellaceae bacterium]
MEPEGGTTNRITVLYDAFGRRPGLFKDWGFAALVEFEGRRILFDTGNDSHTFAANAAALGVDLRTIDLVVISHRHGDHTSGLDHLLRVNPDVPVYAPAELYGAFGSSLPGHFYPRRPSLPRSMQYYDGEPPDVIRHGTPWPEARFTWIEESTPLGNGAWLIAVVSEVAGTRELRELSLALLTSQGLVLVVGCSHPGIERILQAATTIDDRVHCIAG